ncbi:MAG: hypothetical protein KAI72_03130, partial [Candidatus Pacebacteria bacterium]|nr:hypothetical protein [Candidatus Paceibacterota bacterium]
AAQTDGDLIVDNNNNNSNKKPETPLLTNDWTFDNLTVSGAGNLNTNEYNLIINNNLTISSNSIFILTAGDNLAVNNNFTISNATFNLGASCNVTYSTFNWSDYGIIIDNGGTFELLSGGGALSIPATSTLYANIARTFTGLTVNGILTHSNNTTTETNKLNYIIEGDAIISSGGSINVNAKGYQHSAGPGQGGDSQRSSGAGYGGNGGVSEYSIAGGSAYGSITAPINLGSGGGDYSAELGGAGGGVVKLTVTGTMTIAGNITANGGNSNNRGGGGSGGSIYLITGTLAGTSTLSVNGGTGFSSGAGGGGRIAVYYTDNSSSTISYQAYGGSPAGRYGGAGTIYLKDNTAGTDELVIDNNSQDSLNDRYIGKTPINEATAISRKIKYNHIIRSDSTELKLWKKSYHNFIKR